MGKEMGNNNTSAIKEEDNTSEKTPLEDTSELANGISQDVHADGVKEETPNIPTSLAKDVMEKTAKASDDTTIELGKDTQQEGSRVDDVKEKIQTIPTAEAKDVLEKASGITSNNTKSMLENDSLQGDTHASDVKMENQMLPTALAEDVQEKATGLASDDTTIVAEEDNTSEAEKKTPLEDTSELANGMSQDVHADGAKEENPNIPTSIANDVMEKAAKASDDTTIEVGEDTRQEGSRADDVKEKIQTIPAAEAKDVQEKATGITSNNRKSMLENDSLEGDTQASDVNMENQMHPTAEAEDVQEKATGLASDDTTIELENDTLQEDSHADDVKEKIQTIPTAESKDVQEKATGLTSNNTTSKLENDSLEGDTHASDVNMDNQMHPTAEAEDIQEKAAGLDSDFTRSSFEKDLLKGDIHADDFDVDHQKLPTAEGKDDQEIAARLSFDDKTSEPRDKPEDKQDGNVVIPIANGTDVQGKITILASDDPLNLRNSSGSAVHEITELRQPEMSPNAGSVEAGGENYENLSSSSLEGTEEYEKQNESCLRKHLLVTYNHHLDNEPSIKQDQEETTVLTLDAVDMSNDSELQGLSGVHSDHDELVKVLSERSLQGSESLQEDNFLDTNSHCQQIKDGVLEKEMESQEKLLCADKPDGRDGDAFGSNLLTKVNYITEDSLNSPLEYFLADNPLKSDHEESKRSRSGSTIENSHDYSSDQCMEELVKEFKPGMVNTYDTTIGSNGDCNGERNVVLASIVSMISNTDQVEEPKVTENGHQFDVCVNNSNKASDETSTVSEQKHSVVPEAEVVLPIAGSTVIDCRHVEGENYKNDIEETNEKPEASMVKTLEGREMSEQCNYHLVTINREESFTLQTSASLLHIDNNHQGNVNQTKSFSATSMPDSDWKQTNDRKYFGTKVDKIDSSNLTVPSLDLVDNEAFEKEGEDYSQHIEATSFKGAELTTSADNMSSEPCSNNSVFANGGYETRESITRLSIESNPDNPNISFQIQKSPSFNLNLQIEARPEESDQTPLLYQDKSANESLSSQTSLLINSMPHAEYGQCMLQREEIPVEEKIVTMERSYSEKSKAPFLGLLKEEEEAHLLVMSQTQDNHAGTKNSGKQLASTSPKGKEKRKPRSSFFSSCMCCATVAN